jgi:F0F1-type ATP synthase epsilon subunit
MNTNKPLTLRILSPEGPILEVHDVTAINVPLADGGGIGIRPGHAPLIAETAPGPVVYQTPGEDNRIEVLPGLLEIANNVATILTVGKTGDSSNDKGDAPPSEFAEIIESIAQELIQVDERAA